MNLPAQPKERLGKQLLRISRTNLSLLVVGQDCYGRMSNKRRGIFCPSGMVTRDSR